VNYAGDVAFLEAVFRRWMDGPPRTILDLGCGTGNHDLPLARRGHQVTGLDLSASQLAVARAKAKREGLSIRFVRGDMRSFDLGREFDAAVCMFGAFGYLLKPADVVRCLRSLRRHLRPGGVFVFEYWQSSAARPAGYQDWFHKAGSDYELVRLSESRYDPRTRLLPIEFRFFVFQGGKVLDRFDETHVVRTHEVANMRALLRQGGFEPLAMYAATPQRKGFARVRKDTFRIMAVARSRSAEPE
jgi:SAM-dependent methyltransferase